MATSPGCLLPEPQVRVVSWDEKAVACGRVPVDVNLFSSGRRPMRVFHPHVTGHVVLMLLTVVASASCRTTTDVRPVQIVQPGAPGEPSRVVSTAHATDLSRVSFTPADVEFMQGMIKHHGQAIEMTDLIATHSQSTDMRKLGQRIALSQADEIAMMKRWLEVRGQSVPAPHAMHMSGSAAVPGMSMPAMLMPGMLTPEEMARLAAARGPAFDRLFLAGMITHHGGALTMVEELFAHPGAGQDSEMFAFASDVDGDQRMEIARMGRMLKELQP